MAKGHAELGFRMAYDIFYFRLDLDATAVSLGDTYASLGPPLSPPDWSIIDDQFKLGPPEWAMLQIGREDYHVRLGIITHPVGLEDWDVWVNYFPTFSNTYFTNFGRMLGAEPGIIFGDGYEVNVWGGFDFDYDAYGGGAGFTTFQDYYGTWSGVGFYPELKYYVGILSAEFYPASEFSIAIDGSGGTFGIEDETTGDVSYSPFLGTEVVLNLLPEAIVHPTFRFQGLYDPDEVLGLASISGSAALTSVPLDGLKISVEGKASRFGDQLVPGIFTALSVHTPEPGPYDAKIAEARGPTPQKALASAPHRNIARR